MLKSPLDSNSVTSKILPSVYCDLDRIPPGSFSLIKILLHSFEETFVAFARIGFEVFSVA